MVSCKIREALSTVFGVVFCVVSEVDFPLTDDLKKRPFGGSKDEYMSYLKPYFNIKTFEKAHNSISSRAGSELFGVFIKS